MVSLCCCCTGCSRYEACTTPHHACLLLWHLHALQPCVAVMTVAPARGPLAVVCGAVCVFCVSMALLTTCDPCCPHWIQWLCCHCSRHMCSILQSSPCGRACRSMTATWPEGWCCSQHVCCQSPCSSSSTDQCSCVASARAVEARREWLAHSAFLVYPFITPHTQASFGGSWYVWYTVRCSHPFTYGGWWMMCKLTVQIVGDGGG